ncbi:MAG: hypothetical protein JNN13_01990 [Planctomycetes bacterium]|nr:hypothetical protein [Planctomycetota bacterium]
MLRPLAPLLFSSLLLAQAPAPAPAGPLAWLPANATNVMVVHDLLPHLQALLASPVFAELVTASMPLQEQMFGGARDPKALQRLAKPFEVYVPREFGLALPTAFWDRLVDVLDAATAVLGLKDQDLDAGEARALRLAAEEAITSVRRVDGLIWVEARDERVADRWFESIAGMLRELDPGLGIGVTFGDGVVTATVKAREFAGGRLVTQLTKLGLDLHGSWDPTFAATLRLDGARLVLQLGERGAGNFDGKVFGDLWPAATPPFAAWTVDCGDNLARLAELQERLLGMLGSPEEAVVDVASQAFFRLQRMLDNLGRYRGAVQLGAEWVWTTEELFDEATETIDPVPVALQRGYAPLAGPGLVIAAPLDFVGATVLDQLATQFGSRGMMTSDAFDQIYDFFAGEESALFEPGTLLVTRPAAFRGQEGWPHGAMPFAAFAVVAKANDDAAAGAFMASLSTHLATVLDVEELAWKAADLGPGIDANLLDLEALAPELASPHTDWDFAPHWCVLDGMFVLSSDPNLTRELAAQMRGDQVPVPASAEAVALMSLRGDDLRGIAVGLGKWAAVVPLGDAGLMVQPLLRAVQVLGEQLDVVDWRLDEEVDMLRDVLRVRWKAAK